MTNEDIWWQENAAGNELTNPNMAKGVARMFMDALEAKYPQLVFYLILFCFVFTLGKSWLTKHQQHDHLTFV